MKVKIRKDQAKIVSDTEMQALQVEAASKIFYSYIATKQPGHQCSLNSSSSE